MGRSGGVPRLGEGGGGGGGGGGGPAPLLRCMHSCWRSPSLRPCAVEQSHLDGPLLVAFGLWAAGTPGRRHRQGPLLTLDERNMMANPVFLCVLALAPQAPQGGAIGVGPSSHIVLLSSNFRWVWVLARFGFGSTEGFGFGSTEGDRGVSSGQAGCGCAPGAGPGRTSLPRRPAQERLWVGAGEGWQAPGVVLECARGLGETGGGRGRVPPLSRRPPCCPSKYLSRGVSSIIESIRQCQRTESGIKSGANEVMSPPLPAPLQRQHCHAHRRRRPPLGRRHLHRGAG